MKKVSKQKVSKQEVERRLNALFHLDRCICSSLLGDDIYESCATCTKLRCSVKRCKVTKEVPPWFKESYYREK